MYIIYSVCMSVSMMVIARASVKICRKIVFQINAYARTQITQYSLSEVTAARNRKHAFLESFLYGRL